MIIKAGEFEKSLHRGGNRLNTFRIQNQLGSYPVEDLRALIQDIRIDMNRVYLDCFGLVQWVGRRENEARLQTMPESIQSDLNSLLYTINATLIVNDEMLSEIAARHGIEI